MTFAIFHKELIDHLRDRRSILSGLIMPVLGPAILLLMFTLMASWVREDRPLLVPVAGAFRNRRAFCFPPQAWECPPSGSLAWLWR